MWLKGDYRKCSQGFRHDSSSESFILIYFSPDGNKTKDLFSYESSEPRPDVLAHPRYGDCDLSSL